MGSVPDLYTTGDNDPEIFPEQYYRHYLYCDACGSFDLESWITPENHETLETVRRWLLRAAILAIPVASWLAWDATGLFWQFFVPGMIVVVGLFFAWFVIDSKIQLAGMRCRECNATYANGTPFFSDLDANPRDLTVADVPRPLGRSVFQRGASVPMEEESSPTVGRLPK